MAAYTVTTDFLAKDSLPAGNAAKKVKGSEFDTEFDNIAAADADNLKISSLATGIQNFLTTPTSANLATAVTNETGSGALVFANTPTLVTPILGTPTSGTLTNCTGLPISTGVSGLGADVATFLSTPSSANLKTAVTDETGSGALVFANTPTLVTPILGTPTSGNLANCTGYPIPAGSVVQVIEATPVTALTTCATSLPFDDTIPQNTEGNEVITATITPTNASNRLIIEFSANVGTAASTYASAALFQDTTANALAAMTQGSDAGSPQVTVILLHEMAAGTTSATTFKIRVGGNGVTVYVNGGSGGSRVFGGVSAARLRVTEIKV